MTRPRAQLAALLVCATAGTASADGGHLQAPAGWTRDDAAGTSLTQKTNALTHFGGATSMASGEAYVPPQGHAARLYVTAVVAKIKDDRDAAARAEVDAFLAAPERAKLTSQKVTVASSNSSVDSAAKQIEASLAWTDADSGLSTTSRMIVVGDAENLIAVTAECSHGDVPGTTTDATDGACVAALGTLDPGLAPEKRVALALAAAGTEPAPPPPTLSDAPPAATMSDGTRAPLPPITVSAAPKRTVDRRPVYVGLGIVVLAALFWWNRRRRERLEATDSKDNDGR